MISPRFFFSKDFFIKIKNPQLSKAFRIKSHLTARERVVLYRLALGKETILEIGSYIGASACCFGSAVKKTDFGKIFCIDTWQNDAMTEGKRDTWQDFQHNTQCYKKYIIPIRGFSTDVIDEVKMQIKSIDLFFIDGNHSYEGVKADWGAYKGFLKEDSIVVFHDRGWAEGVKRVVLEEVSPLVSSFDSLPNMWWGTIKK